MGEVVHAEATVSSLALVFCCTPPNKRVWPSGNTATMDATSLCSKSSAVSVMKGVLVYSNRSSADAAIVHGNASQHVIKYHASVCQDPCTKFEPNIGEGWFLHVTRCS
jgi:hypothetical protein